MRSRTQAAVVVVVLACLGAAPEALAKPPTLLSAGHQDRHPTATWSLPPGVQSRVIEVATSPLTASNGYFFFENVEAFDTLEETQTSWTYEFQLDPGTYYVHVGGLDEPCFYAGACPVREFSQVLTLVIPAGAPPPPPPSPPAPSPPRTILTLLKTGSGSGTVTSDPAGIDCGADCSESYLAGIHVTLTATPAAGSVFAGWANSCATAPRCEVTLATSLLVTARFDLAALPIPPAPPPPPPAPTRAPASTGKTADSAGTLPSRAAFDGARSIKHATLTRVVYRTMKLWTKPRVLAIACWTDVDFESVFAHLGISTRHGNTVTLGLWRARQPRWLHLAPSVCRRVQELLDSGRPNANRAKSLAIVLHETMHAYGIGNEAQANCYAVQLVPDAARLAGLSPARAAYAGQLAARAVRRSAPSAYWRASACRDGGMWDLLPRRRNLG